MTFRLANNCFSFDVEASFDLFSHHAHDLLGDLHHLVVVDGEVPLYYYLSAMSD